MTIPLALIVIVLSLSPVDSDARTGPARPIHRSNLQCRPFLPRRLTQLRRIKRDHRSRIIAAVAAPAAVIRMLAPRRGVVPTSAAPVLFWLGAALCDFSEAVTGCGASSVAAVVVGAVAMVVASIGVACAELDGGAESCRLSGALTAGGAGEMIVESAAPGLRGIALTDLPSTLGSWPHARAHGAVACSCCQGIEADLSAGVAGLQRG